MSGRGLMVVQKTGYSKLPLSRLNTCIQRIVGIFIQYTVPEIDFILGTLGSFSVVISTHLYTGIIYRHTNLCSFLFSFEGQLCRFA